MGRLTRRTGSGFLRLPHARRLDEDIATQIAADHAACVESASCEEGDHTFSWPCGLADYRET